jgi:AraC-like DNA-binding protein
MPLAVETVQSASGISPHPNGAPPSAEAGVTRVVRSIERHPDASLTLASLAREARLSPFHFLRIFERMTGLTPHQYILRARLREAAIRLADKERTMKVIDIALDCGFGDVWNFNRAFRVEFDASPRAYRLRAGG